MATPDAHQSLDTGLIATIGGWVTAVVGFFFTSGKHAQRFEVMQEKVDKLEDVHSSLGVMQNDIAWIKDAIRDKLK